MRSRQEGAALLDRRVRSRHRQGRMGRHRPQQGRRREFFDALGTERAAGLQFVTADGDVVTVRTPDAIICLDTFHVISWATDALDEVRRNEWNQLRRHGGTAAAKTLKGL